MFSSGWCSPRLTIVQGLLRPHCRGVMRALRSQHSDTDLSQSEAWTELSSQSEARVLMGEILKMITELAEIIVQREIKPRGAEMKVIRAWGQWHMETSSVIHSRVKEWENWKVDYERKEEFVCVAKSKMNRKSFLKNACTISNMDMEPLFNLPKTFCEIAVVRCVFFLGPTDPLECCQSSYHIWRLLSVVTK